MSTKCNKQENATEIYNKLVNDIEELQESAYDSVKELLALQSQVSKTDWHEVSNLVHIKNKLKEIDKFANEEAAKLKFKDGN